MKSFTIIAAIICCSFTTRAQVKIGDMAPAISLPNTNDSIVHLNSYLGKVVLIDFWASWCGPCRQTNPAIVKLYNTYKGKGFQVFGVSIDNKKAAWIKAIKDDKIKFIQVSDLIGWNSKVAEMYGVNQIPTSFLLDKTGKIIATDLTGKQLEIKLKQLLK